MLASGSGDQFLSSYDESFSMGDEFDLMQYVSGQTGQPADLDSLLAEPTETIGVQQSSPLVSSVHHPRE